MSSEPPQSICVGEGLTKPLNKKTEFTRQQNLEMLYLKKRNMNKIFLFAILLVTNTTYSQKITTPSGIIVNDRIYNPINYGEIDSIIILNPGWRVPTIQELNEIFSTTYDKAHLRCAVKPGIYHSSNYQVEVGGDTLRVTGRMYGREFKALLPHHDFAEREMDSHSLLLIKYKNQ